MPPAGGKTIKDLEKGVLRRHTRERLYPAHALHAKAAARPWRLCLGLHDRQGTQKQFLHDAAEHAGDATSLAKWSAVNRLDELLPRFVVNFEANGRRVHWARNADESRKIVLDLLRQANAKAVIKSKCMRIEEIAIEKVIEHLDDLAVLLRDWLASRDHGWTRVAYHGHPLGAHGPKDLIVILVDR